MLEKTSGNGEANLTETTRKEALERFCAFFENLSEGQVKTQCRQVYAPDAILHDTLKTIQGIDAIESYFIKTAQRAAGVKVKVEDTSCSGENYYLRWWMTIHWSAYGKKRTSSPGMSLLRFNARGEVILHHDFWDSTNGFFIHLPVIGWMLRQIIRRV